MADEGKAVVASCSSIVLTHDIEKSQPQFSYKPHEGNINCVVWNHNNLVLASSGNDGKIILSHSRKENILLQFEDDIQQSSPITSIQFTSVSSKLASGGSNGRVKIYDLKNKCIAKTYSNHFGGVTSVDWHSNDYIIASSSQVGDIFLYNVENDQQIATFSENNSVQQIKFSPFRNSQLASCCGDGRVSIWDVNSKQQIANFQKHQSKVNAITFSPHNRVLAASASLDMSINFYDINEKKVVKTLPCDQPLTSLAFHNDGHTIIVGTLYGNMIVYDLRKGAEAKNILEGHAKNQPVNYISIVKQSEKNKQSQILGSGSSNQKASNIMNNSRTSDTSNYSNNQNSIIGNNLLPPTSNQFGQTNRLNDTISSLKQKGSEGLPPNPNSKYKKLKKQQLINSNLEENYSDREYTTKTYTNNMNNNNNNNNNIQQQPSSSIIKQNQMNQIAQQGSASQILKQNQTNPISNLSSAKQSQILTNNNNINNNIVNTNLFSTKTSQIISNPTQEYQNTSQTNNQLQRKLSSNLQDEDYKGQNGLKQNYSSKHLYNQSQNSSSKQSQIQPSSSSKITSPTQEDYSEMKKSGLTNVQPYELPPKSSTIIERHNGRSLVQAQGGQQGLYSQQGISNGDDFTDNQKQYIKNLLEEQYMDIKFSFQDQFQNLHVEIIRQFQIQHNEINLLLEQYVSKNKTLEEKLHLLQLENEKLKKSTY